MAKERKEPKEKKPAPLIIQIFLLPFSSTIKLFGGFVGAVFLSIIIEWVGLSYWWRDNPDHAHEMFSYEYEALGSTFKNSVAGINPINIMNRALSYTYTFLFDSWLINGIKAWLIMDTTTSSGLFFKGLIVNTIVYIQATAYVILTVVMRVTIFLLSIPWFLLCAITGFVNGAVEREIRKFEGGIEHGFIYHIAKSHLNIAIIVTWVVYLSLPFAIHPAWILIPGGALFGYNIYVTVWSFKKYL